MRTGSPKTPNRRIHRPLVRKHRLSLQRVHLPDWIGEPQPVSYFLELLPSTRTSHRPSHSAFVRSASPLVSKNPDPPNFGETRRQLRSYLRPEHRHWGLRRPDSHRRVLPNVRIRRHPLHQGQPPTSLVPKEPGSLRPSRRYRHCPRPRRSYPDPETPRPSSFH